MEGSVHLHQFAKCRFLSCRFLCLWRIPSSFIQHISNLVNSADSHGAIAQSGRAVSLE
jgi:hypothetical protein